MKKISILGLEIPAVVTSLILVGGLASAATLSYFAVIQGEADVEQAILFSEMSGWQEGEAQLTYDNFDAGATAGNTVVDGPYRARNNMDEDHDLTFKSRLQLHGGSDYDETSTNMEIGWGDTGLTTTYVDAFADAGHDFDEYEVPDECEVVIPGDDSLDLIVLSGENVSEGDVVCVEEGTYDGVEIDVDGFEVYSKDGQGKAVIDGTVTVKASDVVISGFELEQVSTTSSAEALEVSFNYFNADDASSAFGWNNAIGGGESIVEHNKFEGYSTRAISADHEGIERTIEHNTFIDSETGIGSASANDDDLTIRYNVFTDNDVEGIGSTAEDGSPIIEYNRFGDNGASIKNYGNTKTVEADNNFFYDPFNTEGDVEASFKTLEEDPTVPAGGELWFGAVNEFDVMTSGEYSYDLSTEIS